MRRTRRHDRRQFYGNVSGESIFLAFVLFSWLSRLRFVPRAWEFVVVWLCFFGTQQAQDNSAHFHANAAQVILVAKVFLRRPW